MNPRRRLATVIGSATWGLVISCGGATPKAPAPPTSPPLSSLSDAEARGYCPAIDAMFFGDEAESTRLLCVGYAAREGQRTSGDKSAKGASCHAALDKCRASKNPVALLTGRAPNEDSANENEKEETYRRDRDKGKQHRCAFVVSELARCARPRADLDACIAEDRAAKQSAAQRDPCVESFPDGGAAPDWGAAMVDSSAAPAGTKEGACRSLKAVCSPLLDQLAHLRATPGVTITP